MSLATRHCLLRFAENRFGYVGGEGNTEPLALVRLEHQHNPKDESDEADETRQQQPDRRRSQATCKKAQSEDHGDRKVENVQRAEHDDGLLRMEPHEGTLIDEKKNQSGDPPKRIAQETGNVFLQARVRHSRCGRGASAGCSRSRSSARLRRPATWAKPRVLRDSGSAFCAVWHQRLPGKNGNCWRSLAKARRVGKLKWSDQLEMRLPRRSVNFRRRSHFNAVAALALRVIERRVGARNEPFESRVLIAPESRYPKTRRHAHLFAAKSEFLFHYLLANALNCQPRAGLIRICDHDQELVASDSPADVALPDAYPQNLCELRQNGVAGLVAECIVDRLECIQVRHNHPEREGVPHRSLQLSARPLLHRPSIGQSRQTVRERQLFQEPVLFFELAVEKDDSAAHLHAREQLIGVKRLGEVFVGSRMQAAYNLGFFCNASKQDDVCGGVVEIGAYPLADFDPREVGHEPVGNHEARSMFGKEIERLAAGLGEDQLELIGRKSVLEKFAGDGRIVNPENREGLI